MSKLTFSKHGHVAYQLKWNHKCSHMVANISPTDPQGPGGQKVKIKLFQNIVMLHMIEGLDGGGSGIHYSLKI